MSALPTTRARAASLSELNIGAEQKVTTRPRSVSSVSSASISDKAKKLFSDAQLVDKQKAQYDLDYKNISNLKNTVETASKVVFVAVMVVCIAASVLYVSGVLSIVTMMGLIVAGVILAVFSVLAEVGASDEVSKKADKVTEALEQFLKNNMTTDRLLEEAAWVFKYVNLPKALRLRVDDMKAKLEKERDALKPSVDESQRIQTALTALETALEEAVSTINMETQEKANKMKGQSKELERLKQIKIEKKALKEKKWQEIRLLMNSFTLPIETEEMNLIRLEIDTLKSEIKVLESERVDANAKTDTSMDSCRQLIGDKTPEDIEKISDGDERRQLKATLQKLETEMLAWDKVSTAKAREIKVKIERLTSRQEELLKKKNEIRELESNEMQKKIDTLNLEIRELSSKIDTLNLEISVLSLNIKLAIPLINQLTEKNILERNQLLRGVTMECFQNTFTKQNKLMAALTAQIAEFDVILATKTEVSQ